MFSVHSWPAVSFPAQKKQQRPTRSAKRREQDGDDVNGNGNDPRPVGVRTQTIFSIAAGNLETPCPKQKERTPDKTTTVANILRWTDKKDEKGTRREETKEIVLSADAEIW